MTGQDRNNMSDRVINCLSFLSEGKFIMSASTDTSIHIWDLKGDILASINTNQMTNSYAAISPCGRSVCQPDLFAAFGAPAACSF